MAAKIKIGIIGLGARGSGLLNNVLVNLKDIEIIAVCDVYYDRGEFAAKTILDKTLVKAKVFTDYKDLLKDSDIESVIIASSWESHIDLAVFAMEAGKAVGLEVGGAYTIEDCWKLVETYEKTKTPFMFLENCCYDKTELMAASMARKGLFGEIVYCSGAYSHDVREEIVNGNKNKHYRLRNYLNRNCENYPTHELGPIAKILGINTGNRMVSLVSVASKAAGLERYVKDNIETIDKDLIGRKFKQGDIVNTIITCSNGETISLILDTTLPGYYDRALVIKGTKGMYNQSCNFAIFDGEDKGEELWTGIENTLKNINSAVKFEEEHLPSFWKNITEEDRKTGHGGMDGFMIKAFIDAYKAKEEMPIDVYDAAAWMSIACLSEQSIILGGSSVMVPDFTKGKWITRKRKDIISN